MNKSKNADANQELPKPDYIGVFALLFAFGTIVFIPAIRETLATPLVADQYGIPDSQAVFSASLVISFAGLLAIIIMLFATRFTNEMDDRKAMIWVGFVPLVVSIALHYPIGNKPISIANCSSNSLESTTYGSLLIDDVFPKDNTAIKYEEYTTPWILNEITSLSPSSNSSEECYGCPYEIQPWCLDTPQITPTQLIIVYLLTRSGFSIAMACSQALFSKILGPSPQGVWMGVLSGSASLARIIGPIWISYIYEEYGTIYTYLTLFCLEIIGTLVLLIFYKHLSPMTISENIEEGNNNPSLDVSDI